MGRTLPSFPQSVWDGLTANRESINDDINPNSEDWDRIRDELIAAQRFLQSVSYTSTAAEDIHKHRCICLHPDGIRHAESSDGVLHGFSTSSAAAGAAIQYIIQGRTDLVLPAGDYFLQAEGQIALTPPTTGYVVNVGYSADAFYFRPTFLLRL